MRILYLHGFASGPSSQKAQFFKRRFEEQGVKLEILDLAEGNFEELTISGQLGVIERHARGETLSLIGSSMGGYLAALYAARHPEVEKLVLLAPAFRLPTWWPESIGEEEMSAWKHHGYRKVYHYSDGSERSLRYGIIEDGSQYEDFPEFPQPALIVHGRHDDVVPCGFSSEYAKGKPNVRLVIVDSGHELVDCLELIWPETRRFLQDSFRLSGSR